MDLKRGKNNMDLNHSLMTDSFELNSSISKKLKKTTFNSSKKKTVINVDLSRSTLNQTAKFKSKYKKVQQVNKELALENAKCKEEIRSLVKENNLLRQREVFGTVPADRLKPFLDRTSSNLMAAIEEMCLAIDLCNGNSSAANVSREKALDSAPITQQELDSVPNEPKQKKFHGQPKTKCKFALLEPIEERHFSEILSEESEPEDMSELPQLLFVEQDNVVVGKENKKPSSRKYQTHSSNSVELLEDNNNSLKSNLFRASVVGNIEETDARSERRASVSIVSLPVVEETDKTPQTPVGRTFDKDQNSRSAVPSFFPFPSSVKKRLKTAINQEICPLKAAKKEELKAAKNEELKAKPKKINLNLLGEEIQSPSSTAKVEHTFQNKTNYSAHDMELTEVADLPPIIENNPTTFNAVSPVFNTVPANSNTEDGKTTLGSIKRSANDLESSSESEKESDPDFVPSVEKKLKRVRKANKNFSFFETKAKKAAPKAKTTRKNKKAEAKKVADVTKEKEPRQHDIFDLSCSLNKTSSFIKPYSPRPKRDLSDHRRLSMAEENIPDKSPIEEPKMKSVKSRVSSQKTGTLTKKAVRKSKVQKEKLSDSDPETEPHGEETETKSRVRKAKKRLEISFSSDEEDTIKTKPKRKLRMKISSSDEEDTIKTKPQRKPRRKISSSDEEDTFKTKPQRKPRKKIPTKKDIENSERKTELQSAKESVKAIDVSSEGIQSTIKAKPQRKLARKARNGDDQSVQSECQNSNNETIKKGLKYFKKLDTSSDQEDGKTPDTIVKRNTVRTVTVKKSVLTNKSSTDKEKHSDHSPVVTPFVSKENITKKKLELTQTKPKLKVKTSNEEKEFIDKGNKSTDSRESIQYDPSVINNLRTSNEGEMAETESGIGTSGRPRRGPPKSYKLNPINIKMRRDT